MVGAALNCPTRRPLDASDLACMDELRTVLARHGKLDRFALHLAHRHFVLEPGEVLIERPDPDGRTQHITVGRLTDEPDARPTTWLFDDRPMLHLGSTVYCVCITDQPLAGGCSGHGPSTSLPASAVIKEQQKTKVHRGGKS